MRCTSAFFSKKYEVKAAAALPRHSFFACIHYQMSSDAADQLAVLTNGLHATFLQFDRQLQQLSACSSMLANKASRRLCDRSTQTDDGSSCDLPSEWLLQRREVQPTAKASANTHGEAAAATTTHRHAPAVTPCAGAPRIDDKAPFAFRQPHKRVNWRRIRSIYPDRLAEDADVATGEGGTQPARMCSLVRLPPGGRPALVATSCSNMRPKERPSRRSRCTRALCAPSTRQRGCSRIRAVMDLFEDVAYGDLGGESAYNLSEANLLKVRPDLQRPRGRWGRTCGRGPAFAVAAPVT